MTQEEINKIKLEESWKVALIEEFDKPYMHQLRKFLTEEKRERKRVYPPGDRIFSAFDFTPLNDVKVVILGQDPYHGAGQAHGLCFSVLPSIPTPPSLINIYKELESDLGIPPANHGTLVKWATQGVLLLNSVLTVEANRAASHQGRGWELFTDKVVELINREKEGVVFLLWGSYAQKKGAIVDTSRHTTIESPHPSPLSASRGFFGSAPFSKTNNYLKERGEEPIDWSVGTLEEVKKIVEERR